MTPDGAFDRRLTTWLEEDAAPRAPQGFDDVVAESVNQQRQLPSWATSERWISMQTRARLGLVPRAVILILTLSLLVAALAASLAVAGNLTRADDGGGPLSGLTYHTREGVIYQHPADGSGDRVPLTGEDERASTAFWSPDGSRFAYLSWPDVAGAPTIMIRNADGSNPLEIGERQAPLGPVYFAWSPDGSRFLYWADGVDVADEEMGCLLDAAFCGQRIWSAAGDGGDSLQIIGDPELDACSPTWTPDGEGIVFVGSTAGSGLDIGFYRMDADGSSAERIGELAGDCSSFAPLAISPDGATLAVTIAEETSEDLYLVDMATGDEVLIASSEEDEFGPYWSPDGSMLAYSTMHPTSMDALQRVMLYEVASGETISLGQPGEVVGWSQDGRYIVTWLDGLLEVVDVRDPDVPVVIEIEGATDGDGPSWRPRP